MLVLGILLLLLAAGLFVGFLATGNEEVTFDGGFLDVTVNTLTVYLLGALTLLLLVAGLAFLRSGMRRANRRRKEKKELNRLSAKVEQHEAEKRREPDSSGPAGPAATTDPGATSRTSTDTGTTATSDRPTTSSTTPTSTPEDRGTSRA